MLNPPAEVVDCIKSEGGLRILHKMRAGHYTVYPSVMTAATRFKVPPEEKAILTSYAYKHLPPARYGKWTLSCESDLKAPGAPDLFNPDEILACSDKLTSLTARAIFRTIAGGGYKTPAAALAAITKYKLPPEESSTLRVYVYDLERSGLFDA